MNIKIQQRQNRTKINLPALDSSQTALTLRIAGRRGAGSTNRAGSNLDLGRFSSTIAARVSGEESCAATAVMSTPYTGGD